MKSIWAPLTNSLVVKPPYTRHPSRMPKNIAIPIRKGYSNKAIMGTQVI
jgi:hypothetical protein